MSSSRHHILKALEIAAASAAHLYFKEDTWVLKAVEGPILCPLLGSGKETGQQAVNGADQS